MSCLAGNYEAGRVAYRRRAAAACNLHDSPMAKVENNFVISRIIRTFAADSAEVFIGDSVPYFIGNIS